LFAIIFYIYESVISLRACFSFISTTAGDYFLCPTRRKARSVVFLHKRLTTQAGAKIVPALRVVTEKAPLCVSRRLFRITKRCSFCLDWRFFSSQQRRRWKINKP